MDDDSIRYHHFTFGNPFDDVTGKCSSGWRRPVSFINDPIDCRVRLNQIWWNYWKNTQVENKSDRLLRRNENSSAQVLTSNVRCQVNWKPLKIPESGIDWGSSAAAQRPGNQMLVGFSSVLSVVTTEKWVIKTPSFSTRGCFKKMSLKGGLKKKSRTHSSVVGECAVGSPLRRFRRRRRINGSFVLPAIFHIVSPSKCKCVCVCVTHADWHHRFFLLPLFFSLSTVRKGNTNTETDEKSPWKDVGTATDECSEWATWAAHTSRYTPSFSTTSIHFNPSCCTAFRFHRIRFNFQSAPPLKVDIHVGLPWIDNPCRHLRSRATTE